MKASREKKKTSKESKANTNLKNTMAQLELRPTYPQSCYTLKQQSIHPQPPRREQVINSVQYWFLQLTRIATCPCLVSFSIVQFSLMIILWTLIHTKMHQSSDHKLSPPDFYGPHIKYMDPVSSSFFFLIIIQIFCQSIISFIA